MAKTEAVPTKELLIDWYRQTGPNGHIGYISYWRNPKSKVGFAAAPARQTTAGTNLRL